MTGGAAQHPVLLDPGFPGVDGLGPLLRFPFRGERDLLAGKGAERLMRPDADAGILGLEQLDECRQRASLAGIRQSAGG